MGSSVYIRETLPGDGWVIEQSLRDCEVRELEALGLTCFENMRLGMLNSRSYTFFLFGEIGGMFGVLDNGVVWAVFTQAIDRHPLAFLRSSRKFFEALDVDVFQYVDARNEKAVKWFEWLGFEVSDPVPFGANGEPFHELRKVA